MDTKTRSLSSDFYGNIVTTNIKVLDNLIESLIVKDHGRIVMDNGVAITALISLISQHSSKKESHKETLTRLLAQKLLSEKFHDHLNSLSLVQYTKDVKILNLLCMLCNTSKEICVIVMDKEEYTTALVVQFKELVSQSENINDHEEWMLNFLVLWCLLDYHGQDINQM